MNYSNFCVQMWRKVLVQLQPFTNTNCVDKESASIFDNGILVPSTHFERLNFNTPSALRINQNHKILKILFYVTLISLSLMYHKRTKLFICPKSNRTFMLKWLCIHDFLYYIVDPDAHLHVAYLLIWPNCFYKGILFYWWQGKTEFLQHFRKNIIRAGI